MLVITQLSCWMIGEKVNGSTELIAFLAELTGCTHNSAAMLENMMCLAAFRKVAIYREDEHEKIAHENFSEKLHSKAPVK